MDHVETGGAEATDAESRALLSIMFAEGTADAIRAMRAYAASVNSAALSLAYEEMLNADANHGVCPPRSRAISACCGALGEEVAEAVRQRWLQKSREQAFDMAALQDLRKAPGGTY